VVVWNKHPLSTYAIADRVYIDGAMYYDRLAEDRRLTEAREEKVRLAAAERERSRARDSESQTAAAQSSAQPARVAPRVAAPAPQQPAPMPTTGTVMAITNARIHPITRPVIERGTIVIRGGRIAAIDGAAQPTAGAQVIDAKGADVYPGFVDARSVIGINEPGPRGFEDVSEMIDVNAALKAYVAYQWDSDAIAIARVNGVTSAGVIPAGGLLGGQIAVMNLDGWSWEEATVKPVAGVSFQFPTIGPAGRGGGGRGGQSQDRRYEDLKRERDARLRRVEELLVQARAYGKTPAAERRVDWNLEALVPVVEGRSRLFVQASNERDINDAVAFADRTGVSIVITGGLESPLVASLLKERGIPVILGSILTTPTRPDFHHAATYRAAGELAQAGVTFAFGSGGYEDVRTLPYEAAISVAWGLDRERALRALTIDAAEILGVSDRIGSLEVGKLANLAIWTDDPLEIRTPLPRVWIAGREVGPDNKHLMLYEKFSNRPRRGTAAAPTSSRGGAR
jgi:imidazolonepropionase-like amidohydrolase